MSKVNTLFAYFQKTPSAKKNSASDVCQEQSPITDGSDNVTAKSAKVDKEKISGPSNRSTAAKSKPNSAVRVQNGGSKKNSNIVCSRGKS
jgi:hypothetical protein